MLAYRVPFGPVVRSLVLAHRRAVFNVYLYLFIVMQIDCSNYTNYAI
nr:MAG TPA: hypothetical protein [Caudoviricetes sp.]